MISFSELVNADVSDLPLRTRTSAFFAGTERMANFVSEVMAPMLKGLLKPSDKELAVMGTYYRMCLIIKALVAMNHIQYFQTAASAVRSLFELWLDIKMLAGDTKGDLVGRYHNFVEIERYRTAEQLVSYENAHPGAITKNLIPHRNYLDEPARKQRVAAARIKSKNGKPRYPGHWALKGNVRERACALGLEADYVQIYPLLSWYVHAGSTGVAGLETDTLESCFAICHSNAQKMFLDATITCADVTRIREATIEHFRDWIEELRLTPGRIITEEQIKQIETKKASA